MAKRLPIIPPCGCKQSRHQVIKDKKETFVVYQCCGKERKLITARERGAA